MDDDNRRDSQRPFDNASQPPTRTYSFLLKLSRRLGNVATRSSFINDVRSFLSQEIILPPPQNFLKNGFSRSSRYESVDSPAIASKEDLKDIAQRSHELLISANTVFPITPFPDTVTVDRTKVTVTRRDFFWTSDVMSIRIEDVLNVSASVGPLFGSLTIASRVMSTIDHFKINYFWRSDAIRLKHIIQGYVIAQHNNVSTAHLDKKELLETLVELGHDSNS